VTYYFKSMCVITIALLLCSCFSKYWGKDFVYKKEKNQLRVVTYNINYGERKWHISSPQKTTNAIRRLDGDIVLLQESNPFWQAYLNKQLFDLYPYRLYKHDDSAGGLAILSKYPINNQRYTDSLIGWHPAWIFDVNTPIGVLQMANLHLTPPLISKADPNFSVAAYFSTPVIRDREIRYYYQLINPNLPTIIAGDFNESDNGFVTQFLKQKGFKDAQSMQGKGLNTWRWSLGLITLQRKLDHIFYNHAITETRVQLLHDGDSDHYPLAVDLVRVAS